MNKGLELIEAHHLFGVPYERIDVVVHPQSIVHSLIELNDGAQLAHLGLPGHAGADLLRAARPRARRRHRAAASTSPRSASSSSSGRTSRPSPACASRARPARPGGRRPASLNAADEVAVAAFLDGRIPFTAIAEVVEGDARARSSPRRSPTSRTCSSATPRARERRRASRLVARGAVDRDELGPRLRRLRVADHPPRGRATSPPRRRSGCGSSASSSSSRRSSGIVTRGETEYGIGAIPLGGFVKITGMNPEEEIAPEVAPRAYYRQPVWKRIVVIAGGPVRQHRDRVRDPLRPRASALEQPTDDRRRQGRATGPPAAAHLESGDELVSIDGVSPATSTRRADRPARAAARRPTSAPAARPTAAGRRSGRRSSCVRDGERDDARVTPVLRRRGRADRLGSASTASASYPLDRDRLGGRGGLRRRPDVGRDVADGRRSSPGSSTPSSASRSPAIVGSYEVTRQTIEFDTRQALTCSP